MLRHWHGEACERSEPVESRSSAHHTHRPLSTTPAASPVDHPGMGGGSKWFLSFGFNSILGNIGRKRNSRRARGFAKLRWKGCAECICRKHGACAKTSARSVRSTEGNQLMVALFRLLFQSLAQCKSCDFWDWIEHRLTIRHRKSLFRPPSLLRCKSVNINSSCRSSNRTDWIRLRRCRRWRKSRRECWIKRRVCFSFALSSLLKKSKWHCGRWWRWVQMLQSNTKQIPMFAIILIAWQQPRANCHPPLLLQPNKFTSYSHFAPRPSSVNEIEFDKCRSVIFVEIIEGYPAAPPYFPCFLSLILCDCETIDWLHLNSTYQSLHHHWELRVELHSGIPWKNNFKNHFKKITTKITSKR